MTINGVNQTAKIVQPETTSIQNDAAAKSEKLNSVFEQKPKLAIPDTDLPEALPLHEQEPEQLTRKQAKEWIKEYREKTGCSKKEAKAAFKEEFGYKVPSSMLMKGLRANLIGIIPIAGFLALTGDAITKGKLGIQQFIETGSFKRS